jgi:hypothetical protein
MHVQVQNTKQNKGGDNKIKLPAIFPAKQRFNLNEIARPDFDTKFTVIVNAMTI